MATFTIPTKYCKKDYKYIPYGIMTPTQQHDVIYNCILRWIHHEDIYRLIDYQYDRVIHYETHNNGNIHAHAIFKVYDKFAHYDIHLITMNKAWIQSVGNHSNTYSSNFKWIFDLPKAREYINKQNVLQSDLIEDNYNNILKYMR